MLCYAFLLAIVFLIVLYVWKYFFDRPGLKTYKYPYQEPGYTQCIKYAYFRVYTAIYNKPVKRFNNFNEYGRNSIDSGIFPTDLDRKFEVKKDFSNQDADEIQISGFDFINGNVLDISLARQDGMKGQMYLYFLLHHDGEVKKYKIPSKTVQFFDKPGEEDVWIARDLRMWCLEPLKKWRIFYNGFAENITNGEVDQVKFCYIWRPYTAVMDNLECATNSILATALANATSSDPMPKINSLLNQYDLWGVYLGYYSINGEKDKESVLRGNKTRRIGKINWKDVHRYIDLKMYFEDGTVCNLIAVSLLSGVPEILWGYIELSSNRTHKITGSDYDFARMQPLEELPNPFSFRLKTDHDEYTLNLMIDQEGLGVNWGENESIAMKISKVSGTLIRTEQNLIKKGLGTIHFGVENAVTDARKLDSFDTQSIVFPSKVTNKEIMEKDVLVFSDFACTDSALTGGKGSSLAILSSISKELFSVPQGFCITISAYEKHLKSNPSILSVIRKAADICRGKITGEIQQLTKTIEEEFVKSELSLKLKSEIEETLNVLCGEQAKSRRFAIRSSALGEDGEEMSGAGQMETLLGCKGIDQICEAVKKCWASLFGFKAIEYRRQNGQVIDVGMSVVVQEMVAAEAAGVMFTRDPRTGSPKTMSIASNHGLGESVVAASADPDNITVARAHDDTLMLQNVTLGKKATKVLMNENDGIETVSNEISDKQCSITDDQILMLARIGIYVEQKYGDARDIEWAILNGKLYLLQSRPITSLYKMTDHEYAIEFSSPLMSDKDMISSGNVKEVLPGARSPIWNSFYDEMFQLSMCRQTHLLYEKKKPNYQYMRTSFTHKWNRFFNRTEMAFKTNIKDPPIQTQNNNNGFDIALNGRIVKNDSAEKFGIERHGYVNKCLDWKMYIEAVKLLLTAGSQMKKMKKKYGELNLGYEHYTDMEKLSDTILFETENFVNAMEMHVQLSLASIFMNTFVLVELLGSSTDVSSEQYGDFGNLMAVDSTDNVESANLPLALKELANAIIKAIGKEKFASMSKEEAVQFLTSESSPIKSDYDAFISRHGHRCLAEFDPLSKPWCLDPSKLVAPLLATMNSENAVHVKKNVDEVLKNLKTPLSQKQKKKVRGHVLKAREYVAYREQAKSLLIRTCHELRKGFIRLGELMVLDGRLPDAELLMYMSHVEIKYLTYKRSSAIIQNAIKRRKLHPTLGKLKFPEFSEGFPVEISKSQSKSSADETCIIEGTPVSQGIVEGPARIVEKVEDAGCIQVGDILVTAATDIAWSPYFSILSGVITEIGGLISHGAVVARECGIPCVVGVTGATETFKSGEMIRLDGNIGKIERLGK